MNKEEKLKSGFAGVMGKTNVGKSTFINEIVGEDLLITSDKVQTTRNRIRCIYNTKNAQVVFVDTPGLNRPQDLLSRHLLKRAYQSLKGLDLLVYLVEPWIEIPRYDRKLL